MSEVYNQIEEHIKIYNRLIKEDTKKLRKIKVCINCKKYNEPCCWMHNWFGWCERGTLKDESDYLKEKTEKYTMYLNEDIKVFKILEDRIILGNIEIVFCEKTAKMFIKEILEKILNYYW